MHRMRHQFSVYDYVIFGAVLIISVLIGIYYAFCGTRQNTTTEFLTGNRNMQLLPIAISIMTSFISAIMILGTPAEMYTSGTLYMIYIIGACLGCLLASLCFVPLMYPLKLTSSYEYLERRFQSVSVKLIATLLCTIQQVIYLGIASYAPSTALHAVTELPERATILLVGVVATIYTCLGGLKAVVWSDVFQALIMLAGLLAIVIKGTVIVGGIQHVWEVNKQWGRIHFNEFRVDPTIRHTFWNLLCGATIGWMATFGTSQASVQRYSSLPSLRKARLSILINIGAVSFFIFLACITGIVVFSFYATKGCDPLTSKQIENTNQIIPYFVMEVLGYPGLPGLFIACLFSGALSSVSSSLNGLAAITWEGFLKKPCKSLSEAHKSLITKSLVVAFGALGVSVGFVARELGGTVLQASLSFTGASGGPMTGLFILGSIFPWATWKGAVAGGILGIILPLWISIGSYMNDSHKSPLPFPIDKCNISDLMAAGYFNETFDDSHFIEEPAGIQKMYKLSYLWYSSLGIVGCVTIGLVVSLITGPNKASDVDPKYLMPIFDRICCDLPKFLKRKFRYRFNTMSPGSLSIEREKSKVDLDLQTCKQNEPKYYKPNKDETTFDVETTKSIKKKYSKNSDGFVNNESYYCNPAFSSINAIDEPETF
ncbi:sodium-coupled monocarboxylate transporter 2 isoform X1 [Octopus bimaculoides]|nr:sodium-coupled monocarboxylate transporter 2 isoform X1 [Octopus bimaculoides]|eukprot:XP_014778892.1 PREDICTED: sodium-coupled monocarboxylate transporter 2-like [Octopus bimaculoides]